MDAPSLRSTLRITQQIVALFAPVMPLLLWLVAIGLIAVALVWILATEDMHEDGGRPGP